MNFLGCCSSPDLFPAEVERFCSLCLNKDLCSKGQWVRIKVKQFQELGQLVLYSCMDITSCTLSQTSSALYQSFKDPKKV